MAELKRVPFTTRATFTQKLLGSDSGTIKLLRPTDFSDEQYKEYLESCKKTCSTDCSLFKTRFCGGIGGNGEVSVSSPENTNVPDFFERKKTPCSNPSMVIIE
jgi:hypothetical protein